MLALAAVSALRAAVSARGTAPAKLALPATPEAIQRAIVETGEPEALAAR